MLKQTFFQATPLMTDETTFTLDLELAGDDTGPGFYWVRMQVQVPDGDDTVVNLGRRSISLSR